MQTFSGESSLGDSSSGMYRKHQSKKQHCQLRGKKISNGGHGGSGGGGASGGHGLSLSNSNSRSSKCRKEEELAIYNIDTIDVETTSSKVY